MKWHIATPFSRHPDDLWLGNFVPAGRHRFETIPFEALHDRSRSHTSSRQWLDYLGQGQRAFREAYRSSEPAGIITCFPQLPVIIGGIERIARSRMPILAWSFNLGHTPDGLRRRLSRLSLAPIARFVVHSRAEVAAYSEWLDLPADRFEFVPLQRPATHFTSADELTSPYLIAMGSAGRDYGLLFRVVESLGLRTIVVAGRHAFEGLRIPENVEILSGLSIEQCHHLLSKARFSVTPIANTRTASGQVTLLDAMRFSKAQVVTACPGSVDYLTHDREALLVPAGDVDALRAAISRLWDDEVLRREMGMRARDRMVHEFSDEAVGLRLHRILNQLAPE